MPKDIQEIEKAKGKPMLVWAGKKALDKVEYYPAQEKEFYGDKTAKEFNKLFWGDNLQVLSHLLKENRGKVDLIYIDPPFDSKADYVKKIKLKGEIVDGQQQSLLEEKQYGDIWEKDEYLQFMYERLLIMRELLADTGSIYLHCDWHRNSYLRLVMDEIFGEDNFINEVVWRYSWGLHTDKHWNRKHDTILFYSKSKKFKFDGYAVADKREAEVLRRLASGINGATMTADKSKFDDKSLKLASDVWDVATINAMSEERGDFPTQKPEALLERIVKASSNTAYGNLCLKAKVDYKTKCDKNLDDENIEVKNKQLAKYNIKDFEDDVVLDCFMGSGTSLAVAQKLGRRWIGCDINLGAIQTTIKRLNGILADEKKEKSGKLLKEKSKGLSAFKVYNVNDYDIFKNEIEAKEIIIEMYGVEPIKRSYFDGLLDNNFVKIMPLNRVLNKLDIKTVIKNTEDKIGDFTAKKTSKASEETFEEGVLVICSGVEIDITDFLKKENKTGVKIEVRDILTNKQNLIFKQKPEAKIKLSKKGAKATLKIEEFFSPILIRKLELENKKTLKDDYKAKIKDFRQTIDSVAIDIDYNGKLFNAAIMDLPNKKEVIRGEYEFDYKGKGEIAIKIVDVLGEEYFEVLNG
jgi:Adenine specific DNA methylase Mod